MVVGHNVVVIPQEAAALALLLQLPAEAMENLLPGEGGGRGGWAVGFWFNGSFPREARKVPYGSTDFDAYGREAKGKPSAGEPGFQ